MFKYCIVVFLHVVSHVIYVNIGAIKVDYRTIVISTTSILELYGENFECNL